MDELAQPPKQTLNCDMQAPIVADSPASLSPERANNVNDFPDISGNENADQQGVNQTSFVQRTSLLLELTRHKQNQLLFFVFSVFLGLVVFTRMCTPLFTPTDQLQFGTLSPPQLAGDCVLNDVTDVPAAPHFLRFALGQHNLDLAGKGRDEFGEFELVGKLIPPNKIHLEKIHHNSQLHDTQIMDGEMTLDFPPLYAHGNWIRAHAIDASKKNLQAEGYWDATFYSPNPQPKFTREGIFSSPKAIMEYFHHGPASDGK